MFYKKIDTWLDSDKPTYIRVLTILIIFNWHFPIFRTIYFLNDECRKIPKTFIYGKITLAVIVIQLSMIKANHFAMATEKDLTHFKPAYLAGALKGPKVLSQKTGRTPHSLNYYFIEIESD